MKSLTKQCKAKNPESCRFHGGKKQEKLKKQVKDLLSTVAIEKENFTVSPLESIEEKIVAEDDFVFLSYSSLTKWYEKADAVMVAKLINGDIEHDIDLAEVVIRSQYDYKKESVDFFLNEILGDNVSTDTMEVGWDSSILSSYLTGETSGDFIAVDPVGCGCTECLIGEYIPYDKWSTQATVDDVNNLLSGSVGNNTNRPSFQIAFKSSLPRETYQTMDEVLPEVVTLLQGYSYLEEVAQNSLWLDEK